MQTTKTASLIAVSCLAALLAGLASGATILMPDDDEEDLVPTGKGWGERAIKDKTGKPGSGTGTQAAAAPKAAKTNNITAHGGPVMTNPANVYYIWYGNWAGNTATDLLQTMVAGLSGSPYYNINTTYYNPSKVPVSNKVNFAGATTDNYSGGTALSDAAIKTVVSNAISSNRLPKDANGVYFVLTSADVNATSGFCNQYCGWHTHATISGTDIKYAFVGNPDRCPSSCAAQNTGPNGNRGADAMASIIAHELDETVTDPDLNAWYDRSGAENADKCAWTFGTASTAANGEKYNVTLGGKQYLIQQNWVNSGNGYCAMSY